MPYGIVNVCLVGSRNIPRQTILTLAPFVDLISHAYPRPAPDVQVTATDGIDMWLAGNYRIKAAFYMPFEREIGQYGNRASLYQRFFHPFQRPALGYFTGNPALPGDPANKSSWLLYDLHGDPATYDGDPQGVLDTTKDEVIDWQINTYLRRASSEGFGYVFLDNLGLDNSFGPAGENPYVAGPMQIGPDGISYQQVYTPGQQSAIAGLTVGQANYARYASQYPGRLKRGLSRNNLQMKIISNFHPGGSGFSGPFTDSVVAFSDAIYYEEGFLNFGCPFDPSTGDGFTTGQVRNTRYTGSQAFTSLLAFTQYCRDTGTTDFIMQEMTGRGLLVTPPAKLSISQQQQRDTQIRNALSCYLIAYYPGLYLSLNETTQAIGGAGNYGNDVLSNLLPYELSWLRAAGATSQGIGTPTSYNPVQVGSIWLRYYDYGLAAFNSAAQDNAAFTISTTMQQKSGAILQIKNIVPLKGIRPPTEQQGAIQGTGPWTITLGPQQGFICLYAL